MADTESPRTGRPLTSEEYELTRWILEHGKPKALQFLEQLDRAKVVSGCPCGSASIDFEIEGLGKAPAGVHVLGDFIYGTNQTSAESLYSNPMGSSAASK